MRDYETVIIWSASIPDADLDKEHDIVVEIINGNNGTYRATDKWSRRMLAYPVKKQTEGIYHFLKWNGNSEITDAIDKHLRIHEGCLRYLTLRDESDGAVPVAPVDYVDTEPEEDGGE